MPVKRLKVSESSGATADSLKTPFPQDADAKFDESASEDDEVDKDEESKNSESEEKEDESESDEDEEEDEDELELLREYAKIKKEREEEQRRKELLKMEELKKKQMEEILTSNPLLNKDLPAELSEAYSLKKRWYEETVFKNQARTEPKLKKRFINDTVRSDFHRKFLVRFIQ